MEELTMDDIYLLAHAASLSQKGERDYLLVMVLTVLEASEALSLKPESIVTLENKKIVLDVLGRGGKVRPMRCPPQLADRLRAYAQKHHLSPSDRFFPFRNRQRPWQIVKGAAKRAELDKRISPRLLRHSFSPRLEIT